MFAVRDRFELPPLVCPRLSPILAVMAVSALFGKLLAAGLPLGPHLETICRAWEERGTVVLRADPGSGKSTLLPLALLAWQDRLQGEGPAGPRGKILMLEPRRAAAAAAAARMAELLGEAVGERVGYAVRMERRVSARTRIEVLTEGLLVRRIQGDPELRGVSTVIFDEFHERSVHADLALALALDLRRMGSSLRIIVMSATLDGAAAADSIGGAELIECPGRVFPVDISYRPLPGREALGRDCGAALGEILQEERGEGRDFLVFLPGRREIADAAARLGAAGDFEVLPLHGGLPLSRQREIIAPAGGAGRKRRIILSTNLAETSLTIPGIGTVVDSGYTRLERYHLPSGMNRLSTELESRSSAEQRAGRAGRLERGRCVRLWAEGEGRPEKTEPEIRRTDLSALVLECLIWGVREPGDLPWLESPSAAAWAAGLELLRALGAAGENREPTEKGREMVRLGLEPRLACLCLAGREAGRGGASLAAAAAALLALGDGSGLAGDGDFRTRLAPLRRFEGNRGSLRGEEWGWALRVRETAADLGARLFPEDRGSRGPVFSWTAGEEADLGKFLAAAFPDRVAQRQDRGRFRFPPGREARIEGPLENAEWLAAAEADAGERLGYIRLAAPLGREEALRALESRTTTETEIVWKGLAPRRVVRRRAGRISLGEERTRAGRGEAAESLPALLEREGLAILPWEEAGSAPRRLLERIRFFAARGAFSPGDGPRAADWTGESLIAAAAEWLGPFLWEGGTEGEGPVLDGPSLVRALEGRIGGRDQGRLDKLVPPCFLLPNGKKRPLDYGSGEPVLSLRLQDAFGIAGKPGILGVPLTFELLSPAGRPVQITRDLPGFWAGSYAEVRRELRGRYPKHRWPEDPRGA
jgi:ATP-dependent helicase HrpB